MNLIIDFEESSVTIELLDNPVVNKWLDMAKNVNAWRAWETGQTYTLEEYKGPRENKELRRKGLISAIRNFEKETEIYFPFRVEDTTDFSRQDLNDIHRYFTTASAFHSWRLDSPKLINFVDKNYDLFNFHLDKINSAVHMLEGYYSTKNMEMCQNVKIMEFISTDQPANYYNLEPGDWRYLDYDLEYDVFIRYAILGKDYFQAFLDEDDPRQWDVTAQTALHANNFYIDIDNNRNDFMRTEIFKYYVKQSTLYTGAWQFMPLGKIVSGTIEPTYTFKGIRLE